MWFHAAPLPPLPIVLLVETSVSAVADATWDSVPGCVSSQSPVQRRLRGSGIPSGPAQRLFVFSFSQASTLRRVRDGAAASQKSRAPDL